MLPTIVGAMLAIASPTRASANLASYVTNEDYPVEAIRKEEQGQVSFQLDVSPQGTVSRCTIVQTSGSSALDETTCRIMSERARFTPAKDRRGRSIADSVRGAIKWVLPEGPNQQQLRAFNTIWEVTGAGGQRSCRTQLELEGGELVNLGECGPVDQNFVRTAANYLGASPDEVLTVRLENRWTLDPILPFALPPSTRGEVLARAEGDYRLNEDLSVRDCVEGRFSARFDWRTAPCFRTTFAEHVPVGTLSLRMEVQWLVNRGADSERPPVLPSSTMVGGKLVIPDDVRPKTN